MKKLFVIIATGIAVCTTINSKAQLANTKWTGVFNVPDPTDCTLLFGTDSVYLIYSGTDSVLVRDTAGETNFVTGKDNFVIEVMSYKINGDTLTIQKLNGGSPCSTDDIGKYHAVIKEKQLSIERITEECDARSEAWPLTALKKAD